MTWDGRAPLNTKGGVIGYLWPHEVRGHTRWTEPEWSGTYRFLVFERGRSAAHAVFENTEDPDQLFPMFLTDLAELIRRGGILEDGVVEAKWRASKRGANYGIRLAP